MASTISAGLTSGTALNMSGDTSGALQLQTNGTTTAVTINTSQQVGIGTSSPSDALQVASGGVIISGGNLKVTDGTTSFQMGVNNFATGYGMGTTSSTPLIFAANGSERMRIDTSGNLLVGVTSTFTSIVQGIQAQAVGGASLALNRTTNTGAVARFFYAGTEVGNISVTGSATTFNSTSDYRLKENVVPMTDALNKVSLLKPVTYTWKADGSAGQGFIAHELQAIIPDAVTGEKDAIDKNGNPEYQSIDPRNIVATLTAAIQELNAKVEAQAATITALQAKVGV